MITGDSYIGSNRQHRLSDQVSANTIQWETLVTGVGAVVAAYFTVRSLRQQIHQTRELADDQRRRRARAARATLPLALSQLTQYATSCIKELCDLRPCFQADGSVDRVQGEQRFAAWKLPHLPENILSSLQECIEFVDDEAAQAIVELIRHLQLQTSRLTDYISRFQLNDGVQLLIRANIDQAMWDAAEVHARTSTLFPFSRGYPTGSFTVTRNRICEALRLARCFDDDHEIDELADKWQRETLFRAEAPITLSCGGSPVAEHRQLRSYRLKGSGMEEEAVKV
jgi:hypothetical protein